MRDLSRFADGSFDLVFHAVSNCFVSEVRPMWREVARVLRPGGVLLAGFANPIVFAIDPELEKAGEMRIRYGIPYSDVTSLTDEERRRWTDANEPLCFGHTLEDQIGGQCDAGLAITALFEDGDPDQPLTKYLKPYLATRAVKSSRACRPSWDCCSRPRSRPRRRSTNSFHASERRSASARSSPHAGSSRPRR